MSETTTLPFTWASDALARDEYTVMVRTSPQGQWTRAWNNDTTTTSPAVAQQHLDLFTKQHDAAVKEAQYDVLMAPTGPDLDAAQVALDTLRATEYRVFRRTTSPFAPA